MCNFFSVLHPTVGIIFYALRGLNPLRCVSHVLLVHRSVLEEVTLKYSHKKVTMTGQCQLFQLIQRRTLWKRP